MLHFRTNPNYTYTEIKSRLNSGNACYRTLLIPFSSHMLSKNIKIKVEKIITTPVVLYGQGRKKWFGIAR
jgi:hypothetical protein